MFVVASLQSQTCGDYIFLEGKGIADNVDKAVIVVPDIGNITMLVAEAVYKAPDEPESVTFRTDYQEVTVSPEAIPINGDQTEGWYTSVFRATLDPAPRVELDFGSNIDEFFSFVLYIFVEDGSTYTIPAGELTHVWKNEEDPFVMDIPIPYSEEMRDITLRFGITEMTSDSREAIFSFLVNGAVVEERYTTWETAGTNSYIFRELFFEDVPGDVENIVMTMLSENEGGDSFISGVVLVDLPCEEVESEVLCSYTQGFYGNEGGKTCQGWTTWQLLDALLDDDPLVMGGGDNTFTIPSSEEGGVQCVLDILPGGGPSSELSGESSCDDMGTIETNKQGRIKNSLLAQGITLSLNLRLSPELEDFPVDGETFTAYAAEDCINPVSEGIPGSEKHYAFSADVADKLGEGATVQDLLDLVNDALAGEDISPLSLSQVSDAATMVNEAFDECVVVMEMMEDEMNGEEGGSGEEGSTKGVLGISREEAGKILDLYPNPVKDRFFLGIPARVTEISSVGIFDMSGVLVKRIEQEIQSGRDQVIEVNVSQLNTGIYFIRIESGAGSAYKRFGVQ